MKRLFKKNQIIITTLAIMIAIAGYLNYSGTSFSDFNLARQANTDGVVKDANTGVTDNDAYMQIQNALTLSSDAASMNEETNEASITDIESLDSEEAQSDAVDTSTGNPGEAVLASTGNVELLEQAKLNREQTRAKSKESLLDLINNTALAQEEKQNATQSMINLTENAEREAAAELLLEAKGFEEVIVSIMDGKADVVVNMTSVDDASRAQIEDIVKRKTGISGENIIITPMTEIK